MAKAAQLALLPEDLEGFDLDAMACTKCTLGCNVIRIVPLGSGQMVLCGKKRDTQEMLNAKRERLGIPAPGAVS